MGSARQFLVKRVFHVEQNRWRLRSPSCIRQPMPANSKAIPPKVWAAIRTRYLRGEPMGTIAEDYPYSETTLRCRASKEGLGKLRKTDKTDLSVETEMTVGVVSKPSGNSPVITRDSVDAIGTRVRSRLAANIEATVARADLYSPADLREEGQLETVLASVTKRAATVFGWSESQASTLVSVNLLGALPDREIVVSAAPDAGPADPG